MDNQSYISVFPQTRRGSVYGTKFLFSTNLPKEYTSFAWDFGDRSLISYEETTSHIFQYPGIYSISLSAWTDYGKMYVSRDVVDVDFVYRDALRFESLPEVFNHPGSPNFEPFVIGLTSSKIDQPLAIILQPINTKSVPHYAVPDKWNFLVPTWRFTDEYGNTLKDNVYHITPTPLYDENNTVVGVSGKAEFYYIDDLPTDYDSAESCPLLIAASLSTQHFTYPLESIIYPYASYSNNETVKALQGWRITNNVPTSLRVSENYINDIHPIKWAGIPIPTMITTEYDPAILDLAIGEWELPKSKAMGYPLSNELGNLHSVEVTLSCLDSKVPLIPNVHYQTESDLKFKATDENGIVSSGYVFTTITPLTSLFNVVKSGSSFVIQTSTVATNTLNPVKYFAFPKGYPIRDYVYISHPGRNVIDKLILNAYPRYCASAEYYSERGLNLDETAISLLQVPTLTATSVTNFLLTGVSEIYAMAFNPIKNVLYACDADQNVIRKYDSRNILVTSVDLSGILLDTYCTPSDISIDQKFNVWVSLYDKNCLLKFDSNLNYILSAGPKDNLNFSSPTIETDRLNSVWSCWSTSSESYIIKFNRRGRIDVKITDLPKYANPIALAITPENNVWVACKKENAIRLYDTNGILLDKVDHILSPSYMTLDRMANVWIAHGYNLCSVYNIYEKTLTTWRFNSYIDSTTEKLKLSGEKIINITPADEKIITERDELWGGLAVDVYNRVFLIDSENNITAAFRVSYPDFVSSTEIIPEITTMPVFQSGATNSTFVPTKKLRSAQAAGDWTGNKWYQKYTNLYTSLSVYGQSTPFKIFDSNLYKVSKINEGFDMSNYMKSLGLTDTLVYNSSSFFDKYLPGILGDGDPYKQGLGTTVYERIANFVSNHADLDTMEIAPLISLANSMAVYPTNYTKYFPQSVKRLINIASIPKYNLKGSINKTINYDKTFSDSLTLTDKITAGQYYIIKDKTIGSYHMIYSTLFGDLSVYRAYELEAPGFKSPLIDNYTVHHVVYDETQVNSIIDWISPYTTIKELSNMDNWLDDNGPVDMLFNNLLTKMLFEE